MSAAGMQAYVMGWLAGLLPQADLTTFISVTHVEPLSETTLLLHLNNGAAIRLGVEYLSGIALPPPTVDIPTAAMSVGPIHIPINHEENP